MDCLLCVSSWARQWTHQGKPHIPPVSGSRESNEGLPLSIEATVEVQSITVLDLWPHFSERYPNMARCTGLGTKSTCAEVQMRADDCWEQFIYLPKWSAILFKRGQTGHLSELGELKQRIHILNNNNFICKTSFILLVPNVLYKLNKWL